MIYIIKRNKNEYKVGFSGDVRRRRGELQVASGELLSVVRVYVGDLQDEKRLHRGLARRRMVGEWYWVDSEKEFVAEVERLLGIDVQEIEGRLRDTWQMLDLFNVRRGDRRVIKLDKLKEQLVAEGYRKSSVEIACANFQKSAC